MLNKEQKKDWEVLQNASVKSGQFYKIIKEAKFTSNVNLEVPLGELAKKENLGLILAYTKRGYFTDSITTKDKFNAQGMEGKAVCMLEYKDALILCSFLEPFRFQIKKIKEAK